jgi:hypothetical protein
MRAQDGGCQGAVVAALQAGIAGAATREGIAQGQLERRERNTTCAGAQTRGKGCGNDGPLESTEKQRQLSRPSHRPLEISQRRRDSHIPTAQLRPGWKSGKPKAGFPLSHTWLATVTIVSSSENQKTKKGNRPPGDLFLLVFQNHAVLETKTDFRIILRLENAKSLVNSMIRGCGRYQSSEVHVIVAGS